MQPERAPPPVPCATRCRLDGFGSNRRPYPRKICCAGVSMWRGYFIAWRGTRSLRAHNINRKRVSSSLCGVIKYSRPNRSKIRIASGDLTVARPETRRTRHGRAPLGCVGRVQRTAARRLRRIISTCVRISNVASCERMRDASRQVPTTEFPGHNVARRRSNHIEHKPVQNGIESRELGRSSTRARLRIKIRFCVRTTSHCWSG